MIETLKWQNGLLLLLDQRLLPNQIKYVSCGNAYETASAIKKMVVRGAPAIGIATAYGIAAHAMANQHLNKQEYLNEINQGITALENSRPTALNLFGTTKQMHEILQGVGDNKITKNAEKLLQQAHKIYQEDLDNNHKIGRFGKKLLRGKSKIMTICNAGALATAGHGTALGVIRSTYEKNNKLSVYACETRPLLQGARLTTWELKQDNIPATLITDNMAGYAMQQEKIDAVIVGADRVANNGDVVNKIGTYSLAILAKHHKIPFFVACPTSTIDFYTKNGAGIEIEQRDISEITGYGNCKWAPDNINCLNPAFDCTQNSLITALITEKGVLNYPLSDRLSALLN